MTEVDILTILPTRPTINIVDVGAMDVGQDSAYSKLQKAGMANIIGFEPVQEECDKLNRMADPGCRYLPYAIGDGRQRTFRICNYPMTSSLYEPNTPLLAKFQNLEELTRVVKTVEIQTHRLDDIGEVADTDYLKLDIQGAELDAMTGAEKLLAGVMVVHTEVEFIPMYKDQPLFSDVDQYLRRQGFLLHGFPGVAGRTMKPLMIQNNINAMLSQFLWADAIYIKNFMHFDQIAPEKLLKLAVILHMQYRSWDLVLEALRVYDTKTGTDLAGKYFQALVTPK